MGIFRLSISPGAPHTLVLGLCTGATLRSSSLVFPRLQIPAPPLSVYPNLICGTLNMPLLRIVSMPMQRFAILPSYRAFSSTSDTRKKKSFFRPILLITLARADKTLERSKREECALRVSRIFECTSIYATMERHEKEGHHFRIGVRCTNAGKNNYVNKIRAIFPEFDGASLRPSYSYTY